MYPTKATRERCSFSWDTQFMGPVHYHGEVALLVWDKSHHVTLGIQGTCHQLLCFFLFYLVLDISPWNGALHVHNWSFSFFSSTFLETSQIWPQVSPNSKSSQVDSDTDTQRSQSKGTCLSETWQTVVDDLILRLFLLSQGLMLPRLASNPRAQAIALPIQVQVVGTR